jgi:hypothetical protein
MIKWIANIYLVTAILAIVAGCSKSGGAADPTDGGGGGGPHITNNADTTPPVVEIYTPTPDQVFSTGNTISVTGKVSDGDGLYRGSIRITNDATGSILKEQLYEIHGVLQYNFTVAYTPSVTAVSDYTVTVSYEDHGQNITSKTVKIKVNP